jgi:hypothetical protein
MQTNLMSRLFKCTRAIVTIELALMIPIMWAFLAGGYDLVNLVYTIFQVNNAATMTANIVSQMPSNNNYYVSNITGLLQSINAASRPINVIGPITPIGTGQGAVIVTIVTQAAATTKTPNPVPTTFWQCEATPLKPAPVSHVGTPTSGSSGVAATLPPPAPGFKPIVMGATTSGLSVADTAVIGESFYLYSPFLFGSGFFGVGVFQLYDQAIYRFRDPAVASTPFTTSALTTAAPNGQSVITSSTGSC